MNKEITALLLAALAGVTQAQTVYRCASSYSQEPCAGGKAVAVRDERTPQQAAQSSASTRRDAALADAMEKQRLEEEKRAPAARVMGAGAGAGSVGEAGKNDKSGAKAAAKHKRKQAQPEIFTAVAPRKAKAKTGKSSR